MRELVLTPKAFDDILAAKVWYEARHQGPGASFERSIEAALMRMQRLPMSFPELAASFRRAIVKRFPYDIYFSVDDQRVLVVLVRHTAGDPQAIIERLRQH